MNYGFSYKGSKSRLAERIIGLLPGADNLYDVFAGGCAITHCGMVSGKWRSFHANDLIDAPRLFVDAVSGKYRDERRFITREMFLENQAKPIDEQDMYIKYVWSFGNNGITYLFGRNVEPLKHEAHDYLMSHGYDGTIKTRVRLIKEFKAKMRIDARFDLQYLEQLERLERLQQLEQLQRLQQLEQLQRLENLTVTKQDYKTLQFCQNSVIYCDPPYQSTNKYDGQNIDYDDFFQWCSNLPHPAYISSYAVPETHSDRFKVVGEWMIRSLIQGGQNTRTNHPTEKLYWNGKRLSTLTKDVKL
jgi:site-specific DNA-adenine methylase